MREAAEYKHFEYDTFRYYVRNGRGPAHETADARKFYLRAALDAWSPVPGKRGPKARP